MSLCVCVCWSRSWTLQSGWNEQDAICGADSCGPKEPCNRWGPEPLKGRGKFWGLSGPLKALGVLLRCTQKQLNRLKCYWGGGYLHGPKELCIIWGWDSSTGVGNFGGLSGPFKSIGSLCCSLCCKTDHSVSITACSRRNNSVHWATSRSSMLKMSCSQPSKLLDSSFLRNPLPVNKHVDG